MVTERNFLKDARITLIFQGKMPPGLVSNPYQSTAAKADWSFEGLDFPPRTSSYAPMLSHPLPLANWLKRHAPTWPHIIGW